MKVSQILSFFTQIKCTCNNIFHAIVAPEAVQMCKKAEAFKTMVSTFAAIREDERKEILFQKEMYDELGFSKKEYKSRLKNIIESRNRANIINDLKKFIELGTPNKDQG